MEKKGIEFFQCPLSLRLCGYSRVTKNTYRNLSLESHNYWQMDLCRFGNAEIIFDHYTLVLSPDDILIIPPGVRHMMRYSAMDLFGCYSFKFDLATPSEMRLNSMLVSGKEDAASRNVAIECVSRVFRTIFPEKLWEQPIAFTTSDAYPHIGILENLLMGIICDFYFSKNTGFPSEVPLFFRKMREFISFRDGAPVSVAELAAYMEYSPGHLRLLIQRDAGMTAKHFIDRERIQIAKRLLHYSSLKIGKLAKHMGFTDAIYFGKFFRKYTGETPGIYRQRSRQIKP